MYHFLKYLLLVLVLGLIFLFFYSNQVVTVSLVLNLPFIDDLASRPIPVMLLIVGAFFTGILFAAFIGALRMALVREEKRKLTQMREQQSMPHMPGEVPSNSQGLPPI